MEVEQGTLLWEPRPDAGTSTRMGRFMAAAASTSGRTLTDYDALWAWSVTDLEGFWELVAEEFDVRWHERPRRLLVDDTMPGARWATGATLNYAEHALRTTWPDGAGRGAARVPERAWN